MKQGLYKSGIDRYRRSKPTFIKILLYWTGSSGWSTTTPFPAASLRPRGARRFNWHFVYNFFLSSYILNQLLICNVKISLRDYYSPVFLCWKIYLLYTHLLYTSDTWAYIRICRYIIYIGATRGCVPRSHQRRQLSGHQCSFVLRNGAETLETILIQ